MLLQFLVQSMKTTITFLWKEMQCSCISHDQISSQMGDSFTVKKRQPHSRYHTISHVVDCAGGLCVDELVH
jgi:hypothetical protein